jgi:hypothetical protein
MRAERVVNSLVRGRYRCPECGLAFVTKQGVSRHQQLHGTSGPHREPLPVAPEATEEPRPERPLWTAALLVNLGLAMGWVLGYGLHAAIAANVIAAITALLGLLFMASLSSNEDLAFLGRLVATAPALIIVMALIPA